MFICSGVLKLASFLFFYLSTQWNGWGGGGFAARDNSRLSRGFLLFRLLSIVWQNNKQSLRLMNSTQKTGKKKNSSRDFWFLISGDLRQKLGEWRPSVNDRNCRTRNKGFPPCFDARVSDRTFCLSYIALKLECNVSAFVQSPLPDKLRLSKVYISYTTKPYSVHSH